MSVSNWKTAWKEHYLHKWFAKRMLKAQEEYDDYLNREGIPLHIVSYRGFIFNPLFKYSRGLSIVDIVEGTPAADILDRQIRIKEDISNATGMLVYVLNYCDSAGELVYLMRGSDGDLRLDTFKKDNQETFQAFKRYELMSDLI